MGSLGEGNFGDGTFGGTGAPNALNLRVTSRTALTVTLAWDYQVCDGWRFYKDDKPVSISFDGAKTQVTMAAKKGDVLKVVPIKFLPSAQVAA